MRSQAVPRGAILPVTVGTAGHIDHGKTSLVRALAGGRAAAVDRLEEEQERGLTIDIGYAELTLADGIEVGVVDVPGHEKFVRNMVAGATGIDVVLLVVAADDGVMPQTREHLQIMSLLGLTTGCIALTKADAVDEEMLALAEADVETLVHGTFLEGAKIVPVSSVTGAGIDDLRAELLRLVRAVEKRDPAGLFRMPVLRVFTAPGFGTVVTGIPVSGTVSVGDELEVQPGGRVGRVRGLQVYHRAATEARAGHRTAVNLADVEHRGVRRGDVLCAVGAFESSSLLDVRLRMLPGLPLPLRHGQEVRVHLGTMEAGAKVLLIGAKMVSPGETGFAQLKLDKPAVAAAGDRFIVRVPARLETLGGGVVLGAGEHRRGKGAARLLEFEERERGLADLRVAVESHVRRAWLRGTNRAAIAREARRRSDEIEPEVAALLASGAVVEIAKDLLLHGSAAEAGESALLAALRKSHERAPLAAGMRKALLPDAAGMPANVADGLLDRLRAARKVEFLDAARVRIAGWAPQLSQAQARRRAEILEILARDPWQTPRSGELPGLLGALPRECDELLALLEDEGAIVRLKDGVVLTTASIADAKEKIAAHIGTSGTLTPADLKELLGASRKYGIPLLEHLDAIGFTARRGDVRILR
jgi:selenocysteine-specific elongation factor